MTSLQSVQKCPDNMALQECLSKEISSVNENCNEGLALQLHFANICPMQDVAFLRVLSLCTTHSGVLLSSLFL
jgi:hypothetical protein